MRSFLSFAFVSASLVACGAPDPVAVPHPLGRYCGGFVGYSQVGQRNVYELLGSTPGEYENVVTALSNRGVHYEGIGGFDHTNDDEVSTWSIDIACDADGASVTDSVVTTTTIGDEPGDTTTETEVTTYAGRCPSVRSDMAAGDSWDCQISGERDTDGALEPFVLNQHVEVSDAGPISVPAGTWDALAVAVTIGGKTTTSWYADGIGRLIDGQSQLVELSR